ncbi:MAG: hypothetical protein JO126_07720 [Alphaproteobacteria bacterium]|nr:hypothetical protein [Alphaproteobacteria bacterium]MBV8549327.1 hypothetical protein [Alphaproteobacteria bacterium]
MRLHLRVAIAAFGLLVCTPALADDPPKSHNFGRAMCSEHFACPQDAYLPPPALLAAANKCITQNFGYTSPDGFFEDFTTPDLNSCLEGRTDAIPKGIGSQLAPTCCIVPATDGRGCVLQCELNTVPQ